MFGKPGSLAYEEVASTWGVKHDLKRLERTLCHIKAVLMDAEEQRAKNQELQVWLGQLKDVFYHTDYVPDEFEWEACGGKW